MTNNQYETMLSIYPNFTDCSIQTFDDNKTKGHQKDESIIAILDQRNYTSQQMEGMLTRLNDRGAGIYFSVNSMKHFEGSGKGNVLGYRKKEYVTRLNAWICDIDGYDDKKGEWWYTKEDQLKAINEAPIKPNIIVESGHGYHLYRFIQGENGSAGVECNENTIEQWTRVCWGICNHFKGDVHIPTDYSRVLRVPGFQHKKDPSNPFVCNMELLDGTYHTYEEMIKAYPNWEKIKKENDKVDETLIRHNKKMLELRDSDGAWYNINALDAIDMLYEISGKHFVNYETFDFKRNNSGYQILVNGEPKSCWIDKNGLIGSYDDGGPTWVNWVKYYRIWDVKEIYQYIKDNHPECIPEKKQATKLDAVIDRIEMLHNKGAELSMRDKSYFELPSKVFEPLGGLISGELGVIIAEPNSGKTTFAMDLVIRNSEKHKSMYVNMEFPMRTTLESRWLDIHGKTKRDLTKDGNMTDEEWDDMEKYIETNLARFEYEDAPGGLELDELVDLIIKRSEEGFELFVVDTLSRIKGNLTKDSHSSQNKCMEVLQALTQKLQVVIILIHHTNKQGTFEGSQKIMDLANFFLVIEKDEDLDGTPKRIYHLKKDKYTAAKDLELYYNKGEYTTRRPDELTVEEFKLKFGEKPF